MELSINGEKRSFPGPLTVQQLLVELEQGMERVAVEVNRAVVPRAQHPNHALKDGDEVEIVTFVGGG